MTRVPTLILLACLALPLCGCSDAKQREESSANLKALSEACLAYYEKHEKYPDTLADLKPVIGTEWAGMKVGRDKSYEELVKNPLTGDNPGYEYVKPPEMVERLRSTIVLYQLRGGKRDEALKVGYLDGSVRLVSEKDME